MWAVHGLRFQANFPIYFWGGSVLAAAHLINRTPTPLLHNKTPFEILFNQPPSYDAIRTFGCLAFAHNHKTKGDKFANKSRKCVFIGYPFDKKGWRLFDLDERVFLVSRDVKFFEEVFPFIDTEVANISPHDVVPIEHDVHDDFADFVFEDFDDDSIQPTKPPLAHPYTSSSPPPKF